MTTQRDPRTRIVLSWLREEAHENAERVLLRALDEVDTTPQRRAWWPAWRTNRMSTYAKLIAAAAAAVLVVAAVGYRFLPGNGGIGGQPTIAPSASAGLLARGSFFLGFDLDREAVELEATGEGSSVTGRMKVSARDYAFTVDLQCSRTTADGVILIGGVTTDTAGGGSVLSPEGTWAGIGFKRGSPVEATTWSQRGGPGSQAATCLAYLDERLMSERRTNRDGDWTAPIAGTVELGP